MSYLVGNPEDRFSHNEAHIKVGLEKVLATWRVSMIVLPCETTTPTRTTTTTRERDLIVQPVSMYHSFKCYLDKFLQKVLVLSCTFNKLIFIRGLKHDAV